jgi:hypothetical protein
MIMVRMSIPKRETMWDSSTINITTEYSNFTAAKELIDKDIPYGF